MNDRKMNLNDGTSMPMVGFGCYDLPKDQIDTVINDALEAGYRYFDNATRYENERLIGNALKRSGVKRESLYLVSKLWPNAFDIAERGIHYSLTELGVDYLDAYYLHWPGVDADLRLRAWEVMLTMQQKGLIKSVGVSNFKAHHLKPLVDAFGVKPVINQIQLHPWYPQADLVAHCRANDIAVSAWSPLFRGKSLTSPVLKEIGERIGKTPAQVVLLWHLSKGHVVLPKSAHPDRIKANLDIVADVLTSADLARIDALENGDHLDGDPDTMTGENFHFRP